MDSDYADEPPPARVVKIQEVNDKGETLEESIDTEEDDSFDDDEDDFDEDSEEEDEEEESDADNGRLIYC